MNVFTRYFCRELLKLLVLTLTIFLAIYLIIEFVQKLDHFLEVQAPIELMMVYLFYKMPYIIVQMTPVAMLISVIVMFCIMKKNNEIMAIKACGINVIGLSKPILAVSFLVAVATFLFSELVVPHASSRSNKIWDFEVKKKDQARFYGHKYIWYRGADSLYLIRNFDSKKNVMDDLTFYFFDKSFQLIKRIDARKGIWTGQNWKIQEGMIQEANEDGGYSLTRFAEIYLNLPEDPEAFIRPVKRPEEMSYWQLKRYAERVQLEGYDATEYLVDMNVKLAFPLINLVMVFLGIPIALGLKKGGTPLAVSLGVGVCFLYLTNLGFARSLGLSGLLPPILSAWAANVVFFFLGAYLMMRLET